MSSPDVVLVMPGNAASGGEPFVAKPVDIDAWPSATATEVAIETLIEIVRRGYTGVKLETYTLSDGRMVFNRYTDDTTPEGRMAEGLMALACVGKSIPVAESLAILERLYLEDGLPPPPNKNARV